MNKSSIQTSAEKVISAYEGDTGVWTSMMEKLSHSYFKQITSSKYDTRSGQGDGVYSNPSPHLQLPSQQLCDYFPQAEQVKLTEYIAGPVVTAAAAPIMLAPLARLSAEFMKLKEYIAAPQYVIAAPPGFTCLVITFTRGVNEAERVYSSGIPPLQATGDAM